MVETGTTVMNSTKDKKERVGRMLLMHANNREDIKEAYLGRHRRPGWPEGYPYRRHALRYAEGRSFLRSMEFPEPVIEIAIEPKSKADQEKLGVALSEACR